MNFGKHDGKRVSDVPDGYLRWCLRECENLEPWLRGAIEAELGRRGYRNDRHAEPSSAGPAQSAGGALVTLEPVVARWYSELTRRWHPDRGGSNDAMQAVNDAHDRLKTMLREALAP